MSNEETKTNTEGGNTLESIIMRQRAYIEAIKPYTKMKADIYSMTMPTMIIRPDGRIEHHHNFTKSQKKILEQLDELIEMMKANVTAA